MLGAGHTKAKMVVRSRQVPESEVMRALVSSALISASGPRLCEKFGRKNFFRIFLRSPLSHIDCERLARHKQGLQLQFQSKFAVLPSGPAVTSSGDENKILSVLRGADFSHSLDPLQNSSER